MTSKLLESGLIDFTNLNNEKGLVVKSRMNPCYCNSKLANAYFAVELAKRTENTGVNVYMVCPGFTYTGLFRNVKRSWFHYIIFSPIALMFLRTANQVNTSIERIIFKKYLLIMYFYVSFCCKTCIKKNLFIMEMIDIYRVHKQYCIARLRNHCLKKVVTYIEIVNFMFLRRT